MALTHFISPPPPLPHSCKIVVRKNWDFDAAEMGMDRAVDVNTDQGGVCGMAVYFVLTRGDLQRRE